MQISRIPARAFSTPVDNKFTETVDKVVIEHVKLLHNYLLSSCEKLESEFYKNEAGSLYEFIKNSNVSLDIFDFVWDMSFGQIYLSIISKQNPIRSAAIFAFRLHEMGTDGEWCAYFPEPVTVRLGGYALFLKGRTSVTSHGAKLSLITESGTETEKEFGFSLISNRWTTYGYKPHLVYSKDFLIVDRREYLEASLALDIAENTENYVAFQFVDVLNEVGSVLLRCHKDYYIWVMKVIRIIAPWKVKKEQIPSGSGSSNFAPGLSGIGNHNHCFSLAESLVHEASHHYFYIALKLGPVANGAPDNLYYNPIINQTRPLDRILLSFHAFANIFLFFRSAVNLSRLESAYIERREAELLPYLQHLHKILYASKNLTLNGRNIFEPLSEMLTPYFIKH